MYILYQIISNKIKIKRFLKYLEFCLYTLIINEQEFLTYF